MNHRAYEFLSMAEKELKQRRPDREKVALFIRLAIPEIQELQQALESYESAQPVTAAFLVERPRPDALAVDDGDGAAVERWGRL